MAKKKYLAVAAGTVTLAAATTTTTTSTATTTTTAPTTTTSSTTTTSTATTALPSGYTAVSASSFGVKCDGVTNDTVALQNAFNGLKSYQALQLPSGSCLYSRQLSLYGKSNVMLIGAGKDATVLTATDPLHSSLIVSSGNTIGLSGFQVYSPNSTTRTTDADSRGIYVENSSAISIDSVKVRKVAGAGILYYIVNGGKVTNSVVDSSLADAFHFTGGSQNILAQFDTATGAGDDCFASIGYGTNINRNVQFLDNSCSDNVASGVSFEGTTGGQAYRNKLTRTGVSAIRVASISGWATGPVDQIDIRDNVLTDVKTRTDVDHSAVMVFTDRSSISNVTLAGNTISNPRTYDGARVLNYVSGTATISNVTIANTAISSTGSVTRCFTLGSGLGALSFSTNSLNTQPC